MVDFKMRGNKYTWKFFFWLDYKLPLSKLGLWWSCFQYKYRYKAIWGNHTLLIKDKWLFWKKPKETGAIVC